MIRLYFARYGACPLEWTNEFGLDYSSLYSSFSSMFTMRANTNSSLLPRTIDQSIDEWIDASCKNMSSRFQLSLIPSRQDLKEEKIITITLRYIDTQIYMFDLISSFFSARFGSVRIGSGRLGPSWMPPLCLCRKTNKRKINKKYLVRRAEPSWAERSGVEWEERWRSWLLYTVLRALIKSKSLRSQSLANRTIWHHLVVVPFIGDYVIWNDALWSNLWFPALIRTVTHSPLLSFFPFSFSVSGIRAILVDWGENLTNLRVASWDEMRREGKRRDRWWNKKLNPLQLRASRVESESEWVSLA